MYPAANKASSVLDVLRAALDVSARAWSSGNPSCDRGACEREGPLPSALFRRFDRPCRKGRPRCRRARCERRRYVLRNSARDDASGPRAACHRFAHHAAAEQHPCEVRRLARALGKPRRARGRRAFVPRLRRVGRVRVQPVALCLRGGCALDRFLPHMSAADRDAWLFARRKHLSARLGENGQIAAEDVLRGAMLPQVAQVLCKCAGIDPAHPLSKKDVLALSRVIGGLRLTGSRASATRSSARSRVAGFRLRRSIRRRWGAMRASGLFAAGEALDVDAPCGGYNLHWAWSSGLLAGVSAARSAVSADGEGEGE